MHYKHDIAGAFAGVSWAEINKSKTPLMQEFHEKLLEKLEPLGIRCLNLYGARYNPHFTLFNTRTSFLENTSLIKEVPTDYFPLVGAFSVEPKLGQAHEQWELEKLYNRIPLLNMASIRDQVNREKKRILCKGALFF